jgi:hypothetical protein
MHDVARSLAEFTMHSERKIVSADPSIDPSCNPSIFTEMTWVMFVESHQQRDLDALKG